MATTYRAPWSRLLKGVSIGAAALLLGVAFFAARALGPADGPLNLVAVGGPLLILLATLLFTIRGYEIAGGELFVRRLLWPTRLSLDGLRSAEANPAATKGSIRVFGNGGLFSFSGLFRNKTLGTYRAWVTDHKNAVVLTWAERTVVVSPHAPESFVAALLERRGLS